MNECLRQELATVRSFKILKLKELLSVQMLFNVGIIRSLLKVRIVRPQDFIFFDFHHALANNLLSLVAEVVIEKDTSSSDKPDKKVRRKKQLSLRAAGASASGLDVPQCHRLLDQEVLNLPAPATSK